MLATGACPNLDSLGLSVCPVLGEAMEGLGAALAHRITILKLPKVKALRFGVFAYHSPCLRHLLDCSACDELEELDLSCFLMGGLQVMDDG